MILAAHQINFIPWLSYFDKMNKSDIFVLMVNCQFEKNGFQNRCKVNGKWWTMPVKRGMKEIKTKRYVNGVAVPTLNVQWINAIAMTLGIDTGKIRMDFPTHLKGTERLIQLCKHYECDQYLTNPDAKKKYLDEKMMNDAGIEVIYHKFDYTEHVFEAFDLWGIEGTQKLLEKERIKKK